MVYSPLQLFVCASLASRYAASAIAGPASEHQLVPNPME
jgi:hypothetical protein